MSASVSSESIAWVMVQTGMILAAPCVVGFDTRRRVAAALLLLAAGVLPWWASSALLQPALVLLPLVCMKTIRIAASQNPWPIWQRIWHLAAPYDVRRIRHVDRVVSRSDLAAIVSYCTLVVWAGFFLRRLSSSNGCCESVLCYALAAVFLYGTVEVIDHSIQFGHLLAGVRVPSIQRSPLLAKSLSEFWADRWNRPMTGWLRRFVFLPLARRNRAVLGVMSAFLVSAGVHAWMAYALLDANAALHLGTFFFVQGAAVAAEGRLRIRTWPGPVARVWTFTVLLVSAPLFLKPLLRVLGASQVPWLTTLKSLDTCIVG